MTITVKRILALLLTVCSLLCLMVPAAFAADTSGSEKVQLNYYIKNYGSDAIKFRTTGDEGQTFTDPNFPVMSISEHDGVWSFAGRSLSGQYGSSDGTRINLTSSMIVYFSEKAAKSSTNGDWIALRLENVPQGTFRMELTNITGTNNGKSDVYIMPASAYETVAGYYNAIGTTLDDTYTAGMNNVNNSMKKLLANIDAGNIENASCLGIFDSTLDLSNTQDFDVTFQKGGAYVVVFRCSAGQTGNCRLGLERITITNKANGLGMSVKTGVKSVQLMETPLAEFDVGNNDFIATSVVNGHDYLYVPHNNRLYVYDLDTWKKVDEKTMTFSETDGAFVDSSGIVWVYGQAGYLYRYDPYTGEGGNTVKAVLGDFAAGMLCDPFELDGKIYLGTHAQARIISYDPVTKTFAHVGMLSEEAVKATTMAYKDGYIYASVHAANDIQLPHQLVKYDMASNQVVATLDLMAAGVSHAAYLTSSTIVGNVLLCAASNQKYMIAVDINTMDFVDVGVTDGIVHGFSQVITEANGNEKVYFFTRTSKDSSKRYFCEYNSATGKVTRVDGFAEPTSNQFNTHQTSFVTIQAEGLSDKSLFMMKKNGTMVFYNLEDKNIVERTGLTMGDGVGVNIIEFTQGPEGSKEIYLGGFMLNQVGYYNYEKNKVTSLFKGYSDQIETIERVGDTLYVSGYGACSIIEMDYKTGEYKLLFALNERHKQNLVQERIQNIAVGDNKVFGTTVPHKGQLGGFIVWYDYDKEATFLVVEEDRIIYLKDSDKSTWYDVKTDAPVVFNTDDYGVNDFKGAVANQVVNSIHYADGYLYGTTYIGGAATAVPAEDSSSVIFVYDVENMEMVTKCDISDCIDNLLLPVELIAAFHPDPEVEGKFWGLVAQTLFTATYDKENKTFDVEEVISFGKDSYTGYLSKYENAKLYFDDGYIFVNVRSEKPGSNSSLNDFRIICMDRPEYNFSIYTEQCRTYALGEDDNIYFAQNTSIYKLESAEVIQTIKSIKANADAVQAQINGIGTVTLESKACVAAARLAYDALSADEKLLVNNLPLIAAETAIAVLEQATGADKAAAAAVQALINSIGTVTLESEEAVVAARTAYDALTAARKELVDATALTAAEEALAKLKAAAGQSAVNQAAADAVQAQINAIGTVTLESEVAIEAARAAYDALTAAQKELVDVTALTAAEAKLADLKEAAADQAAADAVQAQINAIGTVTLESGSAIEAARAAYNALTIAQKELVDITALEAAEAAYYALINLKTGDTMPVGLVIAMAAVGVMAVIVVLVPLIKKRFVR